MSVSTHRPRSAVTLWKVVERFDGISLLSLDIRTGRTHQIRVHCQFMGHPVVGDPVYGNRGAKRQLAQCASTVARWVASVDRQMLHARRLTFHHPIDQRPMAVEAPLPSDMDALIQRLRSLSGG
jgi:23S rRNA pseudouridine1911/1915/1917 synthase